MHETTRLRTISDVNDHLIELINNITEERVPILITLDGEVQVVMADVNSYREMQQEILSLLKILALAEMESETGDTTPIAAILVEFSMNLDIDQDEEEVEILEA